MLKLFGYVAWCKRATKENDDATINPIQILKNPADDLVDLSESTQLWLSVCHNFSKTLQDVASTGNLQRTDYKSEGQSPAAKISAVELNPENTRSHKMAQICSTRKDKSNL